MEYCSVNVFCYWNSKLETRDKAQLFNWEHGINKNIFCDFVLFTVEIIIFFLFTFQQRQILRLASKTNIDLLFFFLRDLIEYYRTIADATPEL